MIDPVRPGTLFDDGKEAGAMRTIGEVSAAFGIKPHVLRYWEAQFPTLKPLKRSGGRRLYRAEDIAMIERIDRLVNREGYTLKGARKAIQSGAARENASADTAASTAPAATPGDTADAARAQPEVASQLRAIRDRLAAALAA